MHLAQINIGQLRYPKGDPRVAEFMDNLARINALAERMPGFVWRLKGENDNATELDFPDDPTMIPNLTVWESVETLKTFVFQTAHVRFYHKREIWLEKLKRMHFAMWWIPVGSLPTLQDAASKLAQLERDGASAVDAPDGVFGWAETSIADEWRRRRCA